MPDRRKQKEISTKKESVRMSGLDKMKARILEEAEQSAGEIIAKANAEADSILESAREKAEKEASKILERSQRDAAEYAKRVDSSVDMRRKQMLLAARQEVIGRVLDEAYDTVMNLDDGKYFAMLEKLLERYVLPQDGTICFAKQDLERMPEQFAGRIKEIAAAKGGSLALSDEARKIDGGFVLVYGGIEENCTIKAVFDSKKEELSDQVNRLLFG